MRYFLFLLFSYSAVYASSMPTIIDKPIQFDAQRVALTKAYIRTHYGLTPNTISITPRFIVVHWTEDDSFKRAFQAFYPSRLRQRSDIQAAGQLNVSAHFLVARDGTIYRLMPETWMARHCIGLNYVSIGIENVGGKDRKEDLTPAQVQANAALIRYLQNKYPTIQQVIGHYAYRQFEQDPDWRERDKTYRTDKVDPGPTFMHALQNALSPYARNANLQ